MCLQPFSLSSLSYKSANPHPPAILNNSNSLPFIVKLLKEECMVPVSTFPPSGLCPWLSSEAAIAKIISVRFVVDQIGTLYSV